MSVFNILTTVVSVVAIFFKIQFLLFELFVFYFFFFLPVLHKKRKEEEEEKKQLPPVHHWTQMVQAW